jgi:carbonic anhydrase
MGWFWKSRKPAPAAVPQAGNLSDELEDADMRDALAGYQRFRRQFEDDQAFYRILADRQEPKMLWIGCSDSRVVPDLITGSDPGSLFVVRNIANIIPPAGQGDVSVGAAVEFAVLHLGIDDIVICGHTGCAGVKAMQEGVPRSETHLHRWISSGAIPAGLTPLEAVKHNILAQRDNLLTYALIREHVSAGEINLHEWLYEMETGEILAYDGASESWRSLSEATAGL